MVRESNAQLETTVIFQVTVKFGRRLLPLFATFGPFGTFKTLGTSGTFGTFGTFGAFGTFETFETLRTFGNSEHLRAFVTICNRL